MPPTSPSSSLEQQARGLERLLAAQLRRIRQRFAIHGIGWMVATLTATTLLYYIADRTLNLPPAVRVLASLGLAFYLVTTLRRRLVYPLSRSFGRDDVAVAMERHFPELRERLISAVQLKDSVERGALRNQSAAMIDRLVEDAASSATSIPAAQLLNPKNTVRVWGIAACAAIAVLTASAMNPEAFGVFLKRIAGGSTSYPRQTTLFVELPASNADFLISEQQGSAEVTMAAGGDLPVLVRVEGVVPREVYLNVEGGRGMAPRVVMTPRGPDLFRHVFRRVSREFTFYASGGDDDHGDLEVRVITVRPPRVQTIRATLTPPVYTGLEPVTIAGGAMEALEGTRVEIQVTTTSEVRESRLMFLESGREIPLVAETVTDDEGSREVLNGAFDVERSDRYQIELVSPGGLKNPHPGTYPIAVVTDHQPGGRILSPTDDSLSVVLPVGIIPLRLEARDDYGLVKVEAQIQVSKNDETGAVNLLQAVEGEAPVRESVTTTLFDVAELPVSGAKASVGDTISVAAELTDNREPSPLTT